MKDKVLQMAVIAPEPMLGALAVLIQSAPHMEVLASEANREDLADSLGERTPAAVLIYLAEESEMNSQSAEFSKISDLKSTWPDVPRVAIVRYASQQENALQAGADIALVEGVSAEKLLAALESRLR